MNAHEQVVHLLNEMRVCGYGRGNLARMDELSDSIETITKAYMVPTDPGQDALGCRVHLTYKERAVAELLRTRLNRIVAKSSISDMLYFDRPNTFPDIKIIDVFVCKLRSKGFGAGGDAPFEILTEWGSGYRMVRRPIPEPAKSALAKVAA